MPVSDMQSLRLDESRENESGEIRGVTSVGLGCLVVPLADFFHWPSFSTNMAAAKGLSIGVLLLVGHLEPGGGGMRNVEAVTRCGRSQTLKTCLTRSRLGKTNVTESQVDDLRIMKCGIS